MKTCRQENEHRYDDLIGIDQLKTKSDQKQTNERWIFLERSLIWIIGYEYCVKKPSELVVSYVEMNFSIEMKERKKRNESSTVLLTFLLLINKIIIIEFIEEEWEKMSISVEFWFFF